jgi:magnesium chelatase family protein
MYRARLSGQFLDRIDMRVDIPAVTACELLRSPRDGANSHAGSDRTSREGASSPERLENLQASTASCDDSTTICQRVKNARAIQQQHFVDRLRVRSNADMGLAELDVSRRLNLESTALIHNAVESFTVRARAAHRCLRVERTIPDPTDAAEIALEHVTEAVQHQVLETHG